MPNDPHDFGLHKAAYSVNETLAMLSIGRTSLYSLVKSKELPAVKLGKKTLFYASDLARLLAKLRGGAGRSEVPSHSQLLLTTKLRGRA